MDGGDSKNPNFLFYPPPPPPIRIERERVGVSPLKNLITERFSQFVKIYEGQPLGYGLLWR